MKIHLCFQFNYDTIKIKSISFTLTRNEKDEKLLHTNTDDHKCGII